MSAQVLREAAALMRTRADAVTAPEGDGLTDSWAAACAEYIPGADGAFVASWHPVVALAIADWLDGVALFVEARAGEEYVDLDGDPIAAEDTHAIGSAIAVARAYLGESA